MNETTDTATTATDGKVDATTNGSGAAAILAAGIGSATIGVIAFIAELSPGFRGLLNFYNPAGPLSGKTTVTIVIWLVAWFVLSRLWRNKNVEMGRVNLISFLLLLVGLILTFPPVWYLFAG
jgi:hypothetical protein